MVTLFLATVIGFYMVIFSLLILFKQDYVRSVTAEIMAHRGMFFIIAILTVILGLLLVVSHNIWVMGWPLTITIFAWLVLIGGIMRLFFPELVFKIWKSVFTNIMVLTILGIVLLLVGLFLLFHVYIV